MPETKKKPAAKKTAKPMAAAMPRPVKKEAIKPKEALPKPMVEETGETVKQQSKTLQYYFAVGRRKESVAHVRLYKNGSGKMLINGKELNVYFPWINWQNTVSAPLKTVGQSDKLDAVVLVKGGGLRGQADAVRHGLARALLLFNPVFRRGLKKAGFLTRDSRVKERKKYGLKKARRGPQWAKR